MNELFINRQYVGFDTDDRFIAIVDCDGIDFDTATEQECNDFWLMQLSR